MAEFVTTALKDMGAAGAAISVLLTAITGCVSAIVLLYRENKKLNAERRTESAAVIKLIESNNTALNKVADSTEERNKVTQELADAIKAQASAFEMVNQRVGFYHEANTDKLKDLREVTASQAEAVRVNTGMVTEVRNGTLAMASAVAEMKAKVDTLLARRSR